MECCHQLQNQCKYFQKITLPLLLPNRRNRSHKNHWQIVLAASEHPCSWNQQVGILPCSAGQPLLQEHCISGDEIHIIFSSCLKIYSWKITQFCRCAVLLGHISNKNESFVTDCAVWHSFPVLGWFSMGL